MKQLLAVIAGMIILLAVNVYAQEGKANAILGNWLTDDDKAVVEIYKCSDRYCGRIVSLKEPKNEDGTDKLDSKNPDPSKRSRKLIGLNLVWGFEYDKDDTWAGGKIYDPDSGKTYSCRMNLEGEKLKVRGYVGLSLIGRTTIWNRK